jgi:hypothetical protein
MKLARSLCILLCLLLAGWLPAQELEEIVKKHLEATGINKVKDLKSYTLSGKADMAGTSGPVKQIVDASGKIRMEVELNGQKIIQVVSGQEGWMIMPLSGSREPRPLSPEQVQSLQRQASLEGLLHQWKEKGRQVSLEGKEKVLNREMHRIKVLESGNQALISYLYIDTDDFLLRAQKDVSYMSGQEVISMTYFDHFRIFGGIQFPMRIESKLNGQTVMLITTGKVEINPELDQALFQKP